jgi:hypothetical protein
MGEQPLQHHPDELAIPHGLWLAGVDASDDGAVAIGEYQAVISTNMADILEDVWSYGSPYESITAYDPDSELTAIEDVLSDYTDLVDELDPNADVDAALDAAITQYDTVLSTVADRAAAVTVAEDRGKLAFKRGAARLLSSSIALCGVTGPLEGGAIALMDVDRDASVDDLAARIAMTSRRDRVNIVLLLADKLLEQRQQKLEAWRMVSVVRREEGRLRIAAFQDQQAADVKYEAQDALWDLDLFDYPQRMFSTIAGAPLIPPDPTVLDRIIGGGINSLGVGMNTFSATGSIEAAAGMTAINLLANAASLIF